MSEKFSIDQGAVRLLAELLNESGLTEIEYQQGESRIRVAKEINTTFPSGISPLHTLPFPANTSVLPTPSLELSAEPSLGEAIVSPMVGTIYTSPEPNAPSYVRVGDEIKEGQILLIIEAMKVMNPIRSNRSGVVTKICITDASPVEFGEVLLYLS